MGIKNTKSSRRVSVNGEKLANVIYAKSPKGTKLSNVSKGLLNMSDSYLSNCLNLNQIGEEQFNRLCDFYGLHKEDYTVTVQYIEDTEKEKETGAEFTVFNNLYEVLKNLSEQNKAIIKNQEKTLLVLGQINNGLYNNTEKVKAIFTEVKYSK